MKVAGKQSGTHGTLLFSGGLNLSETLLAITKDPEGENRQ
jgi:hypothetical protein